MTTANQVYDLAVIGAGITGIGIALAASEQGLKTILLEANSECANEASNQSLRIIHGGFRYLQSLDLIRSCQSILAQKELVEAYPDNIKELFCLMPLNAAGMKSKYPARLGAVLYQVLQKLLHSPIKSPQILTQFKAAEYLPVLKERFSNYALAWSDAQMINPAELVRNELAVFQARGGVVRTQSKVQQVIASDGIFKIIGSDWEVQSKSVVNAAAMGGDLIELDQINVIRQLPWGQSFNLVFKKTRELTTAFAVSSKEGRQYFVVPRLDSIAVGTFTAQADQSIDQSVVEAAISAYNQSCPEFQFKPEDLLATEQGFLPAKRKFTVDADFLNHDLILQASNCPRYFRVYSPKYTTYRRLGRKVVNQLKVYLK